MVTWWPKDKIWNFTKRLWNYSHQVTKTKNLEFYNEIRKLWSTGDQNTKFWILQQDWEVMVTLQLSESCHPDSAKPSCSWCQAVTQLMPSYHAAHAAAAKLSCSCCQAYKNIVEIWSPGDQNRKFWILKKDCKVIVTWWPKDKSWIFTKIL